MEIMDKGLITKSTPVDIKEEHRRILRDLPFPEKVKIVVQLQKIAAPAMKNRGINVCPWKL